MLIQFQLLDFVVYLRLPFLFEPQPMLLLYYQALANQAKSSGLSLEDGVWIFSDLKQCYSSYN